jgi:hypothetical protein
MANPKGFRPPNAGKGRKRGVPNKLTADVKAMILAALDAAGGQKYLEAQAAANPTAFLTLLGRVLPREVDATVEFQGYEPLGVPVEEREPDPGAVARATGAAA